MDAYTTSDAYPYSQAVNLAEVTAELLPPQEVNYIRNSVKVVVDAYDGSVTYYADLDEPIMQAWDRAFPGVFTSIDAAPEEVRDHFRYPENLFQTQAFQYANYHVEDPAAFYRKQDFWEIPTDPTIQSAGTEQLASPVPGSSARKLLPSYQLLRLPGEAEERFHLVIRSSPRTDSTWWVGWRRTPTRTATGSSSRSRCPPAGTSTDRVLVFSRINSDQAFSAARTLLGTGGSEVQFGDLLTIPIEDSILYVLPMYVRARQESAVPELKLVMVVNGTSVSVADNLPEAIEDATGAVSGGEPEPPGGGGGTVDEQVEELLAEAVQHFAAAEAALRAGDLATYQSEQEQAQALVEQATELLTGETGGAASPSPAP